MSPFPNTGTQAISTIQTLSFLCQISREEVARVQTLCYCFGGMKRRKVAELKLWSRQDQARFRSELLFHCTLLLSSKVLQTYLTTWQSHILSTKNWEFCCQLQQIQHCKTNKWKAYISFLQFFFLKYLNAMSIQSYNWYPKLCFIQVSAILIIHAGLLITPLKTLTKSLFQNAMQWHLKCRNRENQNKCRKTSPSSS